MPEGICSVPGCGKPVRALDLCGGHYERHRILGDPLARYKRPTIERVLARVDVVGECWVLNYGMTRGGYVRLTAGGVGVMAHRWAYEFFTGPIPDGYDVDHTCHNTDPGCPGGPCRHRRCVNPDHLEAVPPAVNVLRGKGPSATHARQTHCVNGHELTADNVYRYGNGRACKVCAKARARRSEAGRPKRGPRPCPVPDCGRSVVVVSRHLRDVHPGWAA